MRYRDAYQTAMAALPVPAETLDVPTSFGTVRAYRWAGTDPDRSPVALLPGRGSGTPMWGDVLPGLQDSGRDIIAFDALGDVGMSSQTAPLASAGDQAAWVDQTLESMGVAKAHTVGHSFGGTVAAAHAVHHPARLKSLTLLEPVFVLGWPPAAVFFWATLALLPVPARWRDVALARIGGVSAEDMRAGSAVGDMIAIGAREFQASLPTPRPLTDVQLAHLEVPTYIAVAGAKSLVGGRRALERAERLPHGTVEVWPGTTHSLPTQIPQQVSPRLQAFWTAAA